jgi:predicted NAD/FAD-binding protein
LLDQPTAAEQRILGAFHFQANHAILHRDANLMPKRRKVWSSWNYLAEGPRDMDQQVSVTYWMNRLQRLETATDFFVSLNPPREPESEQVITAFDYMHPLFDDAAIAAQQELPAIQGAGRRWFCGAWTRNGFHEDGLHSAVLAATALGAPPRWIERREPIAELRNAA